MSHGCIVQWKSMYVDKLVQNNVSCLYDGDVTSLNGDFEQQYTVKCEECCSMSTSDEVRTATAFARHHTCLRRAGHVIT